jgi:hypothetical protein
MLQCLDCQVEYDGDKRCPPLVQAARRRGEGKLGGAVPAAGLLNECRTAETPPLGVEQKHLLVAAPDAFFDRPPLSPASRYIPNLQ